MKAQPHKTERIHSLDSLRAIMMLLGVVLHSAITYGNADWGSTWSLKDPIATSSVNDYIVDIIHVFRMQIFFLVAGFFGAMLFYERKPLKMVKNRISRIVFPFIVFLILLWPTVVYASVYTRSLFNGSNNPLADALARFSSIEILIPNGTFHLWFLYYLAIITFVSVGLGLLFKKIPIVSNYISNIFGKVIQKPILRVIIFASLTAVVYLIIGTSQVAASISFIPDFNTFIYFLFFYLVGWVLFKSKHLLDSMMKFDWVCTILGTALFTVFFFMNASFGYEVQIILKSTMIWLFVFGITGLFIRYGSNHSARMRYISDSSYWVYLLHLSFTAIIPSFIVDWPLHAILKFLFVLISTGIICFVSYHYLVRDTFIGKFLNGRKYSRKLSDINKTEELS
jgi:glucans biosynthesis protein C